MRRFATALALCAALSAAACSDDASHGTHAADGAQPGSAPAGSASAFNRAASGGSAASGAAPLAPPVVHYPPDDDEGGKPAAGASAASTPG
ncbi:hypothetical protein [Burkholderia stagnalis]|uniref:Lipoprotein n=1 Tax=Burkholderia stagnalis TaxID=1503054 RepID=A0ABX9YS13_9BURK|nr:hypothetical protein [Burkholderia stagnalis]KVN01034.1 hypothetical protein WT07_17950 [Burkholderia stagnalis]KVN12554.1 hypothetical protein WT09_19975 [Burkholderia stagnalis]KWE05427.1 hypothetical protein WT48_32230 [Burkholderia stagnalis]KWE06442.1 hypothetical protein WT47_17360 [Burkholderia stagnalis]KWK00994.1 hypothetical protein WT76_23180 [Burkholderia stagnalis]